MTKKKKQKKNKKKKTTAVITARQSDNALLHRLLRKKRGQCLKFIDALHVGQHLYSGDDIISGWFEQFKDLSTKQDNDNFNLVCLKQVEEDVSMIYAIFLYSSTESSPVTDDEVKKKKHSFVKPRKSSSCIWRHR